MCLEDLYGQYVCFAKSILGSSRTVEGRDLCGVSGLMDLIFIGLSE